MHYYKHHIGDFLKDTGHLTNEQMGVYLRMLWRYYLDEIPLPDDCEGIAFACCADEKTVRLLLRHFFTLTDDGWRHDRCDREIQEYHGKSDKARDSAKARWEKANALRTHTERNADAQKNDANHKPLTINHEPLEKPVSANADMPATPAPCPQLEIVRLYNTVLASQGLTAVKESLWGAQRQKSLMARWREDKKRQNLDWWQGWFDYIARSDFLMGRTSPKPFYADLDWLLKPANFVKVLEGKYHA